MIKIILLLIILVLECQSTPLERERISYSFNFQLDDSVKDGTQLQRQSNEEHEAIVTKIMTVYDTTTTPTLMDTTTINSNDESTETESTPILNNSTQNKLDNNIKFDEKSSKDKNIADPKTIKSTTEAPKKETKPPKNTKNKQTADQETKYNTTETLKKEPKTVKDTKDAQTPTDDKTKEEAGATPKLADSTTTKPASQTDNGDNAGLILSDTITTKPENKKNNKQLADDKKIRDKNASDNTIPKDIKDDKTTEVQKPSGSGDAALKSSVSTTTKSEVQPDNEKNPPRTEDDKKFLDENIINTTTESSESEPNLTKAKNDEVTPDDKSIEVEDATTKFTDSRTTTPKIQHDNKKTSALSGDDNKSRDNKTKYSTTESSGKESKTPKDSKDAQVVRDKNTAENGDTAPKSSDSTTIKPKDQSANQKNLPRSEDDKKSLDEKSIDTTTEPPEKEPSPTKVTNDAEVTPNDKPIEIGDAALKSSVSTTTKPEVQPDNEKNPPRSGDDKKLLDEKSIDTTTESSKREPNLTKAKNHDEVVPDNKSIEVEDATTKFTDSRTTKPELQLDNEKNPPRSEDDKKLLDEKNIDTTTESSERKPNLTKAKNDDEVVPDNKSIEVEDATTKFTDSRTTTPKIELDNKKISALSGDDNKSIDNTTKYSTTESPGKVSKTSKDSKDAQVLRDQNPSENGDTAPKSSDSTTIKPKDQSANQKNLPHSEDDKKSLDEKSIDTTTEPPEKEPSPTKVTNDAEVTPNDKPIEIGDAALKSSVSTTAKPEIQPDNEKNPPRSGDDKKLLVEKSIDTTTESSKREPKITKDTKGAKEADDKTTEKGDATPKSLHSTTKPEVQSDNEKNPLRSGDDVKSVDEKTTNSTTESSERKAYTTNDTKDAKAVADDKLTETGDAAQKSTNSTTIKPKVHRENEKDLPRSGNDKESLDEKTTDTTTEPSEKEPQTPKDSKDAQVANDQKPSGNGDAAQNFTDSPTTKPKVQPDNGKNSSPSADDKKSVDEKTTVSTTEAAEKEPKKDNAVTASNSSDSTTTQLKNQTNNEQNSPESKSNQKLVDKKTTDTTTKVPEKEPKITKGTIDAEVDADEKLIDQGTTYNKSAEKFKVSRRVNSKFLKVSSTPNKKEKLQLIDEKMSTDKKFLDDTTKVLEKKITINIKDISQSRYQNSNHRLQNKNRLLEKNEQNESKLELDCDNKNNSNNEKSSEDYILNKDFPYKDEDFPSNQNNRSNTISDCTKKQSPNSPTLVPEVELLDICDKEEVSNHTNSSDRSIPDCDDDDGIFDSLVNILYSLWNTICNAIPSWEQIQKMFELKPKTSYEDNCNYEY